MSHDLLPQLGKFTDLGLEIWNKDQPGRNQHRLRNNPIVKRVHRRPSSQLFASVSAGSS
jgi:hypothetical protein